MLPILTPLVLGLVGYEYLKYSRNNEQIGILVNKVAYSNFRNIHDVYKSFGSSEGASLLKRIYDSIILLDQSLVPTYYHHINTLKLSAIIPAAIIDYAPKGVFEVIRRNYYVQAASEYYINSIFSEKPKPSRYESKYPNLGKSGVYKSEKRLERERGRIY